MPFASLDLPEPYFMCGDSTSHSLEIALQFSIDFRRVLFPGSSAASERSNEALQLTSATSSEGLWLSAWRDAIAR